MNINLLETLIANAIGLVVGGFIGIGIIVIGIILICTISMLLFDLVDIIRISIYKWSRK
jgi:hypothetical protein